TASPAGSPTGSATIDAIPLAAPPSPARNPTSAIARCESARGDSSGCAARRSATRRRARSRAIPRIASSITFGSIAHLRPGAVVCSPRVSDAEEHLRLLDRGGLAAGVARHADRLLDELAVRPRHLPAVRVQVEV